MFVAVALVIVVSLSSFQSLVAVVVSICSVLNSSTRTESFLYGSTFARFFNEAEREANGLTNATLAEGKEAASEEAKC